MKTKIYKPVLFAMVLLAAHTAGFAQSISVSVKTKINEKELQVKMDELSKSINDGLKDLGKSLSLSINEIAPKVSTALGKMDINIDLGDMGNYSYSYSDQDSAAISENGQIAEKTKNYSKSYPLDANDKIKISNQYGRITVNTWDKREVKVDVQIKAEARDEEEAQKLINGVQIIDSKNGDLVSFRTEIGRNDNDSWNLFKWGGNKVRKLTINYTVYMPAKTDLNVEQSYGAIVLPDLSGRVKISSSYSTVTAQNLTNTTNEIDGSYGNLKMGSLNGGRLEFSYGNVDMEECNNIKADLSYGSFKLGRLKGAADLNLSYVGGFKIGEITNSFKRLNINSDYSGVSLGISGSSNFDFDVTTTYGGF
ncbi:MAG: hypothetical protein JWP44_856, partial [Mucilaginibacter sp.]|nr:hypothetical protein [Mucilaginibacter sp.]